MDRKKLALEIIERLKTEYPDAVCSLDYDQAWKLLVSVRLAAQCTDARVNQVVKGLFEKYPDVDTLAEAPVEEIEKIVRPCGLGNSKARDISACMKMLKEEYGGKVPDQFEELLKLEDACKYSNELDSTGAVMAKVASTPGSIGYVSLDVLDDTVKALKLDGAEPTEENIKAGKYFLSRPFVMATKGEISEQSDLVKALFDFIYSDEGSELVKSVGLITADK